MTRFEKILPAEQLRPYVRHFAISENASVNTYKVFPSTGLVIGFQYRGTLTSLHNNVVTGLAQAGVTGISDQFKIFQNSPNIGTILVYFTETGLAYFSSCPANELFNQSISLDNILDKDKIRTTEEKLAYAQTDKQRIAIVEQFLVSQYRSIQQDKLIMEAVKRIYQSSGTIKIQELIHELSISQSPFEKRFRKLVGTSPKKFASIVRFNAVVNTLSTGKSLTDICYEYNFFDQAHFTKDFRQYTGDTPENFKRSV